MILRFLKRRWKALALALGGCFLALVGFYLWARYYSPFDEELLENFPQSVVLRDQQGNVVFATVGSDDQWRLPVSLDAMSPWLIQATIALEDERFESHGGVDGLAVLRATSSNLQTGRVVSGASTLDMQVCRMLTGGPRNFSSKAKEAVAALRLNELRSKDEILEFYLNIAPYGGNLRGVEAASRSYFLKSANQLSLAEASLLAGLPQSPERLRPDRHLTAALTRRDKALDRMVELEMISEQMAEDARTEPMKIAGRYPVEPVAPHYSLRALARRPEGGTVLLQVDLQKEVERVLQSHLLRLPLGAEIAVSVIEVESGAVVAMAGSSDFLDPVHGQVNGTLASRSPGSTLKPFVFAAAMEQGRINRNTNLKDVPATFAGWSPRNFDRGFAGEVTVEEALQRSLNLPAVFLAREMGLTRCIGLMEACGVGLPDDAATRGGLALVLGATETNLLSLTNAYATVGRGGIRVKPRFFADETKQSFRVLQESTCARLDWMLSSFRVSPASRASPGNSWYMSKTGTSSGKRDAWSIGHNGKFAVGVWVGRFSGMGDEAFVGTTAAEPLLAKLFDLSPIRVDQAPPEPEPLLVRRPLAPSYASKAKLDILFPEDGAVYQATPDFVLLFPKASRPNGLKWFLNDRLLRDDTSSHLKVGKGTHVLSCMPPDGDGASIRFQVR